MLKTTSATRLDHFPSVSEQRWCKDIDNKELYGISEKFNGAVFTLNDSVYIGYRTYSTRTGVSVIAITKLDDSLNPIADSHIVLHNIFPGTQIEDCRFFCHKGALYMSCYQHKGRAGQVVVLFDKNIEPDAVFEPEFGDNYRSTQKNWIFFSHADQLYCHHSLETNRIFQLDDMLRPVGAYESPQKIAFPYGTFRGGTNYVPFNDHEYLAIAHSSDYKPWTGRRYSMSAYTMRAKLGLPPAVC